MTTHEAARDLCIKPGSVRKAIAVGTLVAVKAGRDWNITPEALDAYRHRSLGKPGRRPKVEAA